MSKEDKYTAETITEITTWAPNLFSFKLTRFAGYRFVPGQFSRLGIKKEDGTIVWRAYSIVSASYDEFLEYFSIVVLMVNSRVVYQSLKWVTKFSLKK
jgi:ferredoxin--NADP+ reductase